MALSEAEIQDKESIDCALFRNRVFCTDGFYPYKKHGLPAAALLKDSINPLFSFAWRERRSVR